MFLEKLLVYKRDFCRIAEFIPLKTFKDVTNLFFAVKKHIGLKEHEHSLKECLSDKLTLIHKITCQIMETYFAPMEKAKPPLLASVAFDQYFRGFTLREIKDYLAG